MEQKVKNYFIFVGSLFLMCAVVLIVILNSQKKVENENDGQASADEISGQSDITDTEPPDTTPIPNESEKYPYLYDIENATITSKDYDSEKTKIAKLKLTGEVSGELLSGATKTLYTLKKVTGEDSEITYVYNEAMAPRQSVEIYLGYIIVTNGDKLDVYNRNGDKIIDGYTGSEPVMVYERDKNGTPVFKAGSTYFYINEEAKAFWTSDFSQSCSYGLNYNFSSGLIKNEAPFSPYFDGNKWGYATDGQLVFECKYQRTYAFSEGLGAVVGENGKLQFIDQNGKIVIDGYYVTGGKSAESIGSFYFDSGYVLVRKKVYVKNKENQDELEENRIVVINKNGDEIYIPNGFEIRSIKGGFAVLSRNGKSGVYDLSGKWVIQPWYTRLSFMSEGLYTATAANGKIGVIDKNGDTVIDFAYSYISTCVDGIFSAYSEESGWTIFCKAEINS